jgi:hypothetical protein
LFLEHCMEIEHGGTKEAAAQLQPSYA